MDQKETVQEYIEFIAYMEQHKRGICIAREKLCSEIDNVVWVVFIPCFFDFDKSSEKIVSKKFFYFRKGFYVCPAIGG